MDNKVEEKTTLSYNFTMDYRFVDLKVTRGFNDELKRIGQDPVIFEEECRKMDNYVNDEIKAKQN
jgi:hypothetical protein